MRSSKFFSKALFRCSKRFSSFAGQPKTEPLSKNTQHIHCYKKLFPWTNTTELSEHLASTIVYNTDGLIALNKPFGIKIYNDDKQDKGLRTKQRFVNSPIQECKLTIEDTLEHLKQYLEVSNLTIVKSAERYSSGIVLLSTNEKTTTAVRRSFTFARAQLKTPHLTNWIITLGYPVTSFKEEKVALKFLVPENEDRRQPVIVKEFGKNEVKQKKVHPVQVSYRVLSMNAKLQTSLVEISTSSVNWHFVRVYASSCLASILGDIFYSNRMNTFMGMPVKLHVGQAQAFDMPPLSGNIARALHVPSGVSGHSMIPPMLHLRSIFLPKFQGADVTITAKPPPHFQWTAEQFQLL